MAVKLYVEVDASGHAMAHALDLVGCFDYGLSKDEAVAKMPEAILRSVSLSPLLPVPWSFI
jgi:hypothetical protein